MYGNIWNVVGSYFHCLVGLGIILHSQTRKAVLIRIRSNTSEHVNIRMGIFILL